MSICKTEPFQESFSVLGGNFDDAGLVSGRIKAILKERGFVNDILRRTAIVAYEAEVNIVSYARQGEILLSVLPGHVAIEAQDEGPGIADIHVAIQQGWSTANDKIREMGFGAGMGLNNIRTFSDVFHISSDVGVGTRLKMIIHTQEGSDRSMGGESR
jgi:anti-sigma regulatory factor (Ser/Thr protein kinase)